MYIGRGGRELVLLHKRFSIGGFQAMDVMRRLMLYALQDISARTHDQIEDLVLTVPGDSYAIIKNSFLRTYRPLFKRVGDTGISTSLNSRWQASQHRVYIYI